MKKHFQFSLLFLFSLIALFLFSCSGKNVTETNDKEVVFSSHQISGCNNHGLLKTTQQDSCFSYSFDDTLKIDFCVVGNCCPDSQRFVTNYNINSDTIVVSVVDTAANLCWCNCNYTIHVEFSGLTEEEYIFISDYTTRYDTLSYREYVRK